MSVKQFIDLCHKAHAVAKGKRFVSAVFIAALGFTHAVTAYARPWKKIEISGAKCGDGRPYNVYLSIKNPKKLAIEFMGGGACWNKATCVGPIPLAWIHPLSSAPRFEMGMQSENSDVSPISEESLLLFPYCTGDVYVGTHIVKYEPNFSMHHFGKINVESGLKQLQENADIRLENLDSLTLFGSSAGAIGALIHMATIEPYLSFRTKKFVIADSPGLHWGPNFWSKFSPQFKEDMANSLEPYDIYIQEKNGNLAGQVGGICRNFSDWTISFLQGAEDLVMSSVFGGISPEEHSRLVHGPHGLQKVTMNSNANCTSWIPESPMHTFLLANISEHLRAGGKTALQYIRDELHGIGGKNYADKPLEN